MMQYRARYTPWHRAETTYKATSGGTCPCNDYTKRRRTSTDEYLDSPAIMGDEKDEDTADGLAVKVIRQNMGSHRPEHFAIV